MLLVLTERGETNNSWIQQLFNINISGGSYTVCITEGSNNDKSTALIMK